MGDIAGWPMSTDSGGIAVHAPSSTIKPTDSLRILNSCAFPAAMFRAGCRTRAPPRMRAAICCCPVTDLLGGYEDRLARQKNNYTMRLAGGRCVARRRDGAASPAASDRAGPCLCGRAIAQAPAPAVGTVRGGATPCGNYEGKYGTPCLTETACRLARRLRTPTAGW
jgi:hypothetical protein